MFGIDLDFKLEDPTYCARAQRVQQDTPLTPRVMVNVAEQRLESPHSMSYLGNAAIAPGTSNPKTANVNVFSLQ